MRAIINSDSYSLKPAAKSNFSSLRTEIKCYIHMFHQEHLIYPATHFLIAYAENEIGYLDYQNLGCLNKDHKSQAVVLAVIREQEIIGK